MRVFLGPARASSLREDGKELTQLLGAHKFLLSNTDTGGDRIVFMGKDVTRSG